MKTKNRICIRRVWIAFFMMTGVLGACTAQMPIGTLVAPTPAPVIEATAEPSEIPVSPMPMNRKLQTLVDQAKEDLTQRANVVLTEIILLDAKSVNWADSSLGCPKPGTMYMQVITPGYLIRLEADGKHYEYHASNRVDTVIFCKNPQPPAAVEPLEN